MQEASQAVAVLQAELKRETVAVQDKKAATAALIESLGRERATVDAAVAASKADEEAAARLAAEVASVQNECASELAVAEPVIREAEAALNSLDKASLGELRSFGSPAREIVDVLAAVMVLSSPAGAVPRDLSWAAGKRFMGNVDAFLRALQNFNKDGLPASVVKRVEDDFIAQPGFKPEIVRSKSLAAAGLCAWVINVCAYFRIYQTVAPKRAALAEANARLAAASEKLGGIRASIAELSARVAALEADLLRATEEKTRAQAQAERTAAKAAVAERLIAGFADERTRWAATVAGMREEERSLLARALLTAAFVVYAGPFTATLRAHLVEAAWKPLLHQHLGLDADSTHLSLVAPAHRRALWAQRGLPTDALSIENAAIVCEAPTWPLLIDPHGQGLRWLVAELAPQGVVVARQNAPNFVDIVS